MSSSMGMAVKSLTKRRLRTAFTVSGIVVGVALILVLLSLSAGTSHRTNAFINTLSPAQITVVNSTGRTPPPGGPGGPEVIQSVPGGGGNRVFGGGGSGTFATFFSGAGSDLDESVVSAIQNLTGVSTASPTLSTTGYVDGTSAFIDGVDPSTYSTAAGALNIVSGSDLSNSTNANQIVVGESFATNLGLSVGSQIDVGPNSTGGAQYTVVGIYSTGNSFTERFAYVPLADAQSIANKPDKVSEIYVKADSPSEVSTVTTEISNSFPGLSAIAPPTFTRAAAGLAGTLTSFFTVIGLTALLAGGFGVVNTMMMSISERTREIGALKAIGAKRGQIMSIFMSEALLIGVIGGFVGVGIGLLFCWVLPSFTGAATSSRFGGRAGAAGGLFGGALSATPTPEIVMLSLGLGVMVGILSGIYPAWRASKMNPVEALRHI
jgi:putative ABC transport system permease protein